MNASMLKGFQQTECGRIELVGAESYADKPYNRFEPLTIEGGP